MTTLPEELRLWYDHGVTRFEHHHEDFFHVSGRSGRFPAELLRLVPVLFVLLTFAACAHPVTDFSFEANGKAVQLTTNKKLPKGSEGAFLSSANVPVHTAVFHLKQPIPVSEQTKSFSLTYLENGKPLELHVFVQRPKLSNQEQVTAMLPVVKGNTPITFLLPLPANLSVAGFQISGRDPSAVVDIVSASLVADYPGVRFGNDRFLIRDGVGLKETRNGNETVYDISFTKLLPDLGKNQAQLTVKYDYSKADGNVRLTVRGGSASRTFNLYPQDGSHAVYFYTASVGFTPEQITITSSNPGFSPKSVEDCPFSAASADSSASPKNTGVSISSLSPIPANFGTILTYDEKQWRNPDYELFSWSLAPSVLVFDFRNLKVQSLYLKRIAYFVEKAGYAGQLWPDFVIDPLHGWNAHDYRPEDLAAFFTGAQNQHFPLNPQEIALQDILLANGIIIRNGQKFAPGKGAIISFSQQGPYWLRYLLLTHEGYHGIYFTHPGYRKAVRTVWNALPPEQQNFWRIYLGSNGYDAKDNYLVVNEFQAYLMQQGIDQVSQYYLNRVLPGLKNSQQFKSASLATYIAKHKEMFKKEAEAIQSAVHTAAGVDAGGLVALVPETPH